MPSDDGRIAVSRDLIALTLAGVTVVGTVVGGALWVSGAITDSAAEGAVQIQSLRTEVRELSYRIDRNEQTALDRWTSTHQRLWAAEIRRRNPSMDVPEVSEIIR